MNKMKTMLIALGLLLVLPLSAQEVTIRVNEVMPDSAADRAGLQAGDRLVELAGRKILDEDDLQAAISAHAAGDAVTIVVDRGGKIVSLPLTFGERPDGGPSIGVMLGVAMGGDPGVDTAKPLGAEQKKAALRTIADNLRDGYLYPDKGRRLAKQVDAAAREGKFADADTLASFVQAVNDFLFEIGQDKHLRIGFGPAREADGPRRVVRRKGGPSPGAAGKAAPDGPVVVRRGPGGDDPTHGFREARVLDGNIGYLDLRMFAGDESAKAAADEAMLSLADTDALIIDLGRNGGGGPWMVRYLSGFLFDEKTHLTDTMSRGMDAPAQRWTLDGQPTRSFADKPVFILTSRRTFSAAESFTFGLKINGRVTIVGERTGGGGHFGDDVAIDEDLRLFLPRGRTYDPRTGDGWEAEGIRPDVEVPYAQALDRAVDEARGRIAG